MSVSSVRTAVLPVAGLGTRFLPITKAVPKEMLPVVDRPCIEWVLAEAVEAGLGDVVLVSARGKGAMEDYFHRSFELERALEGKPELLREVRRVAELARIVTVRQDVALGLGHAVLCARTAVGDRDFAVLLGDDLITASTPAIGQLLAARERGAEALVALMEVPPADTRRYGICAGPMRDAKRMAVERMVEKPAPEVAPSRMAVVGRYVLPNRIFDVLERIPRGAGGEYQLTDALAVLAAEGSVTGYVFDGERFDTGNVLGLLRASIAYGLRRPELEQDLRAMLREMLER